MDYFGRNLTHFGFICFLNSHSQSVPMALILKTSAHVFGGFTKTGNRTTVSLWDDMIPFSTGLFGLPNSPNTPTLCTRNPPAGKFFPPTLNYTQASRPKLNSTFSLKASLVVPPRRQPLCLLNALPMEYIQPHTITVMLRAASPPGPDYPSLSPLQPLPRAWHIVGPQRDIC